MSRSIGIEALAVALPRRYLELEDLARARGVEPEKYTIGLGGRRMAIPDPGEDPVALAATAAGRLLRQTGLDPERIGMLVVGSETAVDHSKPIASYVQGALGLPRAMRVFDTKHACYGGTAALMATAEWIAAGARAEQVGLVITSDVARYGVRSAGEPTQGAGAVALLVSRDPHLLALDLGTSGTFSMDVHDFWRPLGRREALVDGHFSIQCYLDAIAGAYRAWRGGALRRELIRVPAGGLPSDALARILFHVPFCKMARKAYSRLRMVDIEDVAAQMVNASGEQADPSAIAERFQRQVAPSLELCAEVGNIYTGSLYLGLAGLLHAQAGALAGARIGLFSYGSGCMGEFFSGVVGAGAARAIAAARIDDLLARRERIDVAEYERLMALPPDAPPAGAPEPGGVRFTGVKDEQRQYSAAA